MERSAIYRRALAPIVLALGVLGLIAAAIGWILQPSNPRLFVGYWSGIGVLGLSTAYVLARQQALKAGEAFWSAPTRRVTQALLPPLFVGFCAATVAMLRADGSSSPVWWVIPVWMVLYGCAMHAAGFFMPRGMKLFGWGFIVTGCFLAIRLQGAGSQLSLQSGHVLMGSSFGGLHLAYGIYLYFTERKNNYP